MLEKLQQPFKGRKGRPELVDVLRKQRGEDNTAAIEAAEQAVAEIEPAITPVAADALPAERATPDSPSPAPQPPTSDTPVTKRASKKPKADAPALAPQTDTHSTPMHARRR